MKILLSGGGSAGHAYPVILIAQKLKTQNHEILYVGLKKSIEEKLARDFKIPFLAITSGKRRAYFSLRNYTDLIKIGFGIIQAYFLLRKFRPDVIFAKGGYVTVPIVFWLRFFKIPLVIHESDVVIGRANLYAAKYAQKICLGFSLKYYKQTIQENKLVYTGIPVNPEFRQIKIQEKFDLPMILITGGSQGSSKINYLILDILDEISKKVKVYHLIGKKDFPKFSKIRNANYQPIEFTNEMPNLFSRADLVISRAGANTIMEIAAASKPAILIPLSSAANNHQEENAKIFAETNSAVVLNENTLTSQMLKENIFNIIANSQKCEELSRNIHQFDCPNAIDEIIKAINEAK